MNFLIKVMQFFSLWLLLLVVYPFTTFSSAIKGMTLAQQSELIQSYWGSFNKFKETVCSPSDKTTFDKLLKDYKGAGYYIPLHQEKVVKESVAYAINFLDGKVKWLNAQITRLEKLKELPAIANQIQELNLLVENNTKLRYQIDLGDKTVAGLKPQAKAQVDQFKLKYKQFIESIFYLKNYTFPVDHQTNRLTYERLAAQAVPANSPSGKTPDVVIKKFSQFLKRKILEDGAMDPDVTKNDISLRTTIDTFTLTLEKVDDFFSPEIIRDWDWIAKSSLNMQARGVNQQKLRFGEWLARTVATKDYYKSLVNQELKQEKKFLSEHAESADNLKNFVEQKLADVYKYWLKQTEARRNLFVIETILMHEVGSVDPIGDQRKKVVEVVLNRVHDKDYHFLKSADPWEALLGMKLRDKQHWWLNVMYRRGEFSFMYFYMSSVYKVFCPEVTDFVNRLRESNLKLAVEVLKNYEPKGIDTNIYRYFSRISMLGRIDMTAVWSPPYELVEESPGTKIEADQEEKLLKLWKQGSWKYLYSFKNGLLTYRVFEIDGKLYTTLWDKSAPVQFSHYLDRDYFKFFRLPN